MNIKNTQKGFGNILFILLGLAVLAGVFFFLYKEKDLFDIPGITIKDTRKEMKQGTTADTKPLEYEKLETTAKTPQEISDEVIDELDSLMKEIDSTSDENLTDLDL